jgi:RecB family endonuclease NucS
VHSDGGSYKPLNWMSPPCRLNEDPGRWVVTGKSGEALTIEIEQIISDTSFDLGVDPGLRKDGVESHLQELLAAQVHLLGEGWRLVRREYPTAIGPVDLMCRDSASTSVAIAIKRRGGIDGANFPEGTATPSTPRPRHLAVEVKRRAGIDAVEQLCRYVELFNRDPLLRPVGGVLAAQAITPQARTLAEDRGMRCVVLDYDAMRGAPSHEMTLF